MVPFAPRLQWSCEEHQTPTTEMVEHYKNNLHEWHPLMHREIEMMQERNNESMWFLATRAKMSEDILLKVWKELESEIDDLYYDVVMSKVANIAALSLLCFK